jgi:hypothetical protein
VPRALAAAAVPAVLLASNKDGVEVDRRKASTKGIDFRTKTRFDGKTRAVHGQIEATDPFCPSGGVRRAGIGVFYDARLARNGDFYVSGKYRKAPDHGMYLYGYTSGSRHTTKTVHQSAWVLSAWRARHLDTVLTRAATRTITTRTTTR